MELQHSTIDNGTRILKLIGRLDIAGVGEIETRLNGYCSGEKPLVVVDLSGVDFLASIAIRLLTLTAKSIASRGGKMVIITPIPEVHHVLEVTGIPQIIPIYSHFESAEVILLHPSRSTN